MEHTENDNMSFNEGFGIPESPNNHLRRELKVFGHKGTGISCAYERVLKDTLLDKKVIIIDVDKETSVSILEKMNIAEPKDNFLIIGARDIGKTTTIIDKIMNSDIKATIIFDDINTALSTKPIPKSSLIKDSPKFNEDLFKLNYENDSVKYRTHGNNRKVKKRKKAKNGRNKKKK